jgi:hypothetical protein
VTRDRCRPMNLRSCLLRSPDATVAVAVAFSLGKRTTWRHRRARIGHVTAGIRIRGDQTGKCIGATPSEGIFQILYCLYECIFILDSFFRTR